MGGQVQYDLPTVKPAQSSTAWYSRAHCPAPSGLQRVRFQGEYYSAVRESSTLIVAHYQVAVPPELVDEVEQQWAPEAHPIFQLVDPVIGEKIDLVFTELGSPEVTSQSFWPVYLQVLHGMLVNQQLHPEQQAHCAAANQSAERFAAEPIILLPGLRDLREGDTVVGAASGSGAPAGGIQEEPLGFFSDEEYDEDEAGFF